MEQGRDVPAQHKDGADTSETSTILGELGLSGECEEPLSSQDPHARGQ